MGFWDWLRKPAAPKVQTADIIWLTEDAMLQGLANKVQQLLAREHHVLVTAHFPEELGGVVEQFQQAGIAFRPWHPPREIESTIRELSQLGNEVFLLDARELPRLPFQAQDERSHRPPMNLIVFVCHHHPLRTEDEVILRYANAIPATGLMFLTSLDQPLFQRFAGQNIQQLLRIMGMREDEPIENPVIDRQVMRAQEAIRREIVNPRSADSIEEWFQLNLPAAKNPAT
jgi:hypothetical protein